jgi:hypothetical protein
MNRACCLIALIVGVSALAVPASAQPADRPPPDPRFGAVEAFWMPDSAYEARVGWERMLFDWSQLQPDTPQEWNGFNVRLEWLQNALDAQREVVGLLKSTPAWATDGAPRSGVPRGLYLPVDDPDNLWAAFVRRVVSTYRTYGVRRWVIWNEPDIGADVYGHEFDGDVEDYYRLVKVAWQAAHQVDPEAKIHLAGLTYWHDVNSNRPLYLGRLLDVALADPEGQAHGYFFDVVSLHVYFQAETVFTIVRETQQIMFVRGIEKPIWVNETNASPNLDPEWPVARSQFQITLDQQAAFIVQSFALALAAGAERVAVYKFADGQLPQGAESFGLIRADGSRRPAYYALKTVTTYLYGAAAARLHLGRHAHVVTVLLPGGRTAYVLWARSEEPVTAHITATSSSATLVDEVGNVQQVALEGEAYTLVLAAATCPPPEDCLVGGPTRILIQEGQPAPITLISADGIPDNLDTSFPTATPTIALRAVPTIALTPTITRTPRPTLTPGS